MKLENLTYLKSLEVGRKQRQRVMTSTCRIVRPGNQEFNSEAGTYTDAPGAVVYEGKCQFKSFSPVGQRSGDVAGRESTQTMYEVVLPYSDSYDISVSDSVEVSGRVYQVLNPDYSEDRIATHVVVVDQDRGTTDYA